VAVSALEEIGEHLTDVLLFLDGEPLLCPDLDSFVEVTKRLSKANVQIYTNGTILERRNSLVNPGIDKVVFTLSAATRETYEKVHGKDLFREACESVWWFQRHKLPNQKIMMRFIQCRENMDELDAWLEMFSGLDTEISPVHMGVGRDQSDDAVIGVDMAEAYKRSTEPTKGSPTMPCMAWACLAITWDGTVKFCACSTPEHVLGKIDEITIREAWKQRNLERMENEICPGCQTKRDDFADIFNRYLGGKR